MLDRYDTPPEIAAEMVSVVGGDLFGPIADFSVGTGSLLRAAKGKWPSAEVIGIDIDRAVLTELRRQFPNWHLGRADFLHAASRRGCRALQGRKGAVGLVLLNPPFSCRGGQRWKVEIFGQEVRCGTALAFVLESINYLHPSGHVVAILPAGVFGNEKDRKAWKILRRCFEVTKCGVYGREAFPGSFVRTAVVHLRQVEVLENFGRPPSGFVETNGMRGINVGVLRGGQQMHCAAFSYNGTGVSLVHSTDLRNGEIATGLRRVEDFAWAVKGPGVLIPRVGEPRKDKVAVLRAGECIVLSDCVIALLCRTQEEALGVRDRLVGAWPSVAECYSGTCARFITLGALQVLLEGLGVRAERGEGMKRWQARTDHQQASEQVV